MERIEGADIADKAMDDCKAGKISPIDAFWIFWKACNKSLSAVFIVQVMKANGIQVEL